MYQTTKKRASGPKCPVTGKRIQGVCSVYYFLPFHIPFEELGIKDQWFILKDMIYILEKWYRERSAVFILLAAPNSHALCCGWICLYCVLLNGWHGKFSGLFFIFASILIGCLIDSKIKVFFFFLLRVCLYLYEYVMGLSRDRLWEWWYWAAFFMIYLCYRNGTSVVYVPQEESWVL